MRVLTSWRFFLVEEDMQWGDNFKVKMGQHMQWEKNYNVKMKQ